MAKNKKTGGGSRKGKPNKSTQEIKDIVDANVDFSVVVKKLYALVKGVVVQGSDESGDSVYELNKEPNTAAAKLLLEYRFGKPKEQIDITSNGEKLTVALYLPQKK